MSKRTQNLVVGCSELVGMSTQMPCGEEIRSGSDDMEIYETSDEDSSETSETLSEGRFKTPVDAKILEDMGRKRFSENTERKVAWAVQMYRDWRNFCLKNKHADCCIISADLDTLTKLDKVSFSYSLSNFILEVKKKDGTDFPPQTLYQIIISLQFFLETRGLEWKLIDDPVFIRFKNTLDNLMKERAKSGLGRQVSSHCPKRTRCRRMEFWAKMNQTHCETQLCTSWG